MGLLAIKAGDVLEKLDDDPYGLWHEFKNGARVHVIAFDREAHTVVYEGLSEEWLDLFNYGCTGPEAFDDAWWRIAERTPDYKPRRRKGAQQST